MQRLTDFRQDVKKVMLQAFDKARKALKRGALESALLEGSQKGAEAAVSPSIEAMTKALGKSLPPLLKKMLKAGGDAAALNLHEALTGSVRASAKSSAVKVGFEFDIANEKATEWIEAHSLELIDDLAKTTIEDIRAILVSAFEEGRSVDEITLDIRDILDAVDDTLYNANRAETIARTETMEAANEGQLELWDQAVEEGLLTGKEKVVWIVTPDDRLCPICEPLDGETTELGGTFDVDGEEIDGPPAHPNCRCTTGLEL